MEQAEIEAIRIVNAKILDMLAKSLGESNSKPQKTALNQLRSENTRSSPKEPWMNTFFYENKPLHVRTDSENNRCFFPSYYFCTNINLNSAANVPAKPVNTNPKKAPFKLSTKASTNKPAAKAKTETNTKKPAPVSQEAAPREPAPARTLSPELDKENFDTANISVDSNMSIEYDGTEEVLKITPEKMRDKNNKHTEATTSTTTATTTSNQPTNNKRKEKEKDKEKEKGKEKERKPSPKNEPHEAKNTKTEKKIEGHTGLQDAYLSEGRFKSLLSSSLPPSPIPFSPLLFFFFLQNQTKRENIPDGKQMRRITPNHPCA